MKTLLLLRHAESSWSYPGLSDYDRPLHLQGEKEASQMGQRLKEKNINPDIIITSPAARALHTVQIVAREFLYPVEKIITNNLIYGASPSELLHLVHKMQDSCQRILLCGHNPSITTLATNLTPHLIDKIPTCGIVSIKFEVDSWAEIIPGRGLLEYFEYP